MTLTKGIVDLQYVLGVDSTRGGILKKSFAVRKFKIVSESTGCEFESQEDRLGIKTKKTCVSPKVLQLGSRGVLKSELHPREILKNVSANHHV